MKTKQTEHFIEFTSTDMYGEFTVRIVTDGAMQLQLITGNGDDQCYANVDVHELIEIKKMILKVIKIKQKHRHGTQHSNNN